MRWLKADLEDIKKDEKAEEKPAEKVEEKKEEPEEKKEEKSESKAPSAPASSGGSSSAKPGTTDEKIGYDFKDPKPGETMKVLDEPEGEQKTPQEGTDEKIGPPLMPVDNQEIGKAPEGEQKQPAEGEDNKIGEVYKSKDITMSSWKQMLNVEGFANNVDGIFVFAKTEAEGNLPEGTTIYDNLAAAVDALLGKTAGK